MIPCSALIGGRGVGDAVAAVLELPQALKMSIAPSPSVPTPTSPADLARNCRRLIGRSSIETSRNTKEATAQRIVSAPQWGSQGTHPTVVDQSDCGLFREPQMAATRCARYDHFFSPGNPASY